MNWKICKLFLFPSPVHEIINVLVKYEIYSERAELLLLQIRIVVNIDKSDVKVPLLIQEYFLNREEKQRIHSWGFMNIGSIHHKKASLEGREWEGTHFTGETLYCSYFMLIHGRFSSAEWKEGEKKSFYLQFFMLVSDSETIETLLFMYLWW